MISEIINNNIVKYIKNKEFIKFVLENSEEVFWILNEDYKTIFISPSIFELTGYTSEEYLKLEQYEKFSQESIMKINSLSGQINTIEEINELIIEYISKNGQIIHTQLNAKVFFDETNEFKGAYGITKKLTEELRLKNELILEKQKNLEARKFTSNVLGVLGHEFITPLSGILGFTEILSKTNKNSEDLEMLNLIYQSAQRLNATLNSIVTLAAIESQHLEIQKSDVDLFEILSCVHNTFKPAIEKKNITFEIYIDLKITSIITDENCFYQILYHLVDNAIKFTQNGKIFVTISNKNIFEKRFLEVKVEDSGIGINEQKIDIIFEPFRQISEGNDRKYEGLGIGLSTTKKLIEKLNGTITVKSEIDKGSVFTVLLPVCN